MAFENYNILDYKYLGGNVGIKFDISKAFDTIGWDFLLKTLYDFGFNDKLVQWISSILHSAKLSVIINGTFA